MVRRKATSTIFFRHVGAQTRNVYLRINPQAIRVQHGNKGSVVDTLGGYFREVLHSEDPERNGLMLPDLTIECETGVGYRDELAKVQWIWRHHADLKADGTPADTYFMDFVDQDAVALQPEFAGEINAFTLQSDAPVYPAPARSMNPAFSAVQKLAGLTPLAQSIGVNRFRPRAFLIEILGFSWDESVTDPYRIRFNFRCKVLKDLFWQLDDKVGQPLPNKGFLPAPGFGLNTTGEQGISAINRNGATYPLNVAAQVAQISRTLTNFLPSENQPSFLAQVARADTIDGMLGEVLGMTGLGQNQVAQKIADLGQSVFSRSSIPIYPSGSVQQRDGILETMNEILGDTIVPQAPTGGQSVQVGGFSVPVLSLSDAAQSVELQDLKF